MSVRHWWRIGWFVITSSECWTGCIDTAARFQALSFDAWPITVKKEALVGCSGNSTCDSLRRAVRVFSPRTMIPSLGFAMGFLASGNASAAE